MLRRIVAALLCAATVVGGHHYNRRSERAQLFLALFLLWPLLIGITIALANAWTFIAFAVGIAGLFFTWLASAAIAWRDAGNDGSSRFQWRTSIVFTAVVTSLVGASLLFFVFTISSGFAPVVPHLVSTEFHLGPSTRTSPKDDGFWEHLFFGGDLRGSTTSLKPPPTGAGFLAGRFVYEDKPAAGVVLRMTLNGKYETEDLTTDAEGRFVLRLPAGDWYINQLSTSAWKDKPDADGFILVTGREPRLSGVSYSRLTFTDRGWKLGVSENPAVETIVFTIRPTVQLTWPASKDHDVTATVAEAVVGWEPYPGASEYLVRFSEIKRRSNHTSSSPVVAARVNGEPRFPLSRLKHVAHDGAAKEYAVDVVAFAADGTFLSESRAFRSATFTLSDGNALLEERIANIAASESDYQSVYENQRRLDASETLIRERMLKEAETMLTKVKGAAEPGRKEALTGFLMARRGLCKEAQEWFTRAESLGVESCTLEIYRQSCGRKPSTGPLASATDGPQEWKSTERQVNVGCRRSPV